jgi:hypothetical protein
MFKKVGGEIGRGRSIIGEKGWFGRSQSWSRVLKKVNAKRFRFFPIKHKDLCCVQ